MLTSNNLGCMCTTCSPFVVEIVAVPAIFSVLLQTSLTSPESPSSLAASDHPPSVCKSDQSVPHSIPNYMHTSYVQTAICCLLLMLWDYIRDLDYYYTGCVVVTWADCSLLTYSLVQLYNRQIVQFCLQAVSQWLLSRSLQPTHFTTYGTFIMLVDYSPCILEISSVTSHTSPLQGLSLTNHHHLKNLFKVMMIQNWKIHAWHVFYRRNWW